MKKTLHIFLFSLLLIKIGGLVAFLSIERKLMREAMFLKISNNQHINNLTCIIENKNIDWEETNREFWYNKKLYDVVKIEIKNGQNHYYCLADDTETDIVTTIKNLIENNQKPLGKALTGFVSWVLDSVFLLNKTVPTFKPVWAIIEQLQNSFEQAYQFDYYSKTIKPPMMS